MKRNISMVLLLGSLAFVLIVSGCGKPGKRGTTDIDIAEELIQELNTIPLGLSVKVEPAKRIVEPSGKDRYLVIFKDPDITIDTSAYKELNIHLPFKEPRIPLKTKEVVFKYGPDEKYLQLVSLKEMSCDWDFSEAIKSAGKVDEKSGLTGMGIKCSVGNATFKNYDLSPLLAVKAKNLIQLLTGFLGKNQSVESVVDHIRYEFRFVDRQETRSFLLEAEKIESRQAILPDIFISLYSKENRAVDLAKALKEGAVLLDLGLNCSGFKLSVKKNEQVLGEGAVDHLALSYFLKPDQSHSFFIYGFDWKLDHLTLSVPGSAWIERAGHLKEWGMKFSLENLSAAFVQAYFDLLRKTIALSATMDKEAMHQQQMMMGMTIANEFMKAKPVIKCSISPFKHDFGELELDLNFQFLNLMSPPVGKAVVRIPHFEEMLAGIKEQELLPAKILEEITQSAKKYVVVDEKGNGTILFETRADQPGKFFLNGSPIMK
jgi:hypothetical protein